MHRRLYASCKQSASWASQVCYLDNYFRHSSSRTWLDRLTSWAQDMWSGQFRVNRYMKYEYIVNSVARVGTNASERTCVPFLHVSASTDKRTHVTCSLTLLFLRFQMMGTEQFSLKWNNHTNHLVDVFGNLLQAGQWILVTSLAVMTSRVETLVGHSSFDCFCLFIFFNQCFELLYHR